MPAHTLWPGHRGDIALQILELVVAHRDAEVLARYVLDLVRLVENGGRVLGNDAAVLPVLHRQVREQQVVVDDDDVALEGALVHQGEEAALELEALLAGAQIAARIHLPPHAGGFRQGLDLRAVAGGGGLLPVADDLEIGHLLQPLEHRLLLGVVDFLAAGVVVAALHVADAHLAAEVLLQERDVLVNKLLLEILGGGGNHDALAGNERRDQVSQRLAGAGAGLDDEMALVGERGLHRLGHLELAGAELVAGVALRKQ